jgi:hypothetical protein
MGTNRIIHDLELDCRAICYARFGMDDPSRPTYLSHRRDYGWTCTMHCHGHDLESTREGGFKLLRYFSGGQFGPADCPVLTLCALVHQCHQQREESAIHTCLI